MEGEAETQCLSPRPQKTKLGEPEKQRAPGGTATVQPCPLRAGPFAPLLAEGTPTWSSQMGTCLQQGHNPAAARSPGKKRIPLQICLLRVPPSPK